MIVSIMPVIRPSLLLFGMLLILVGCNGDEPDRPSAFEKEGTLTFYTPDDTSLKTIDVEIADSDAERQRGLMHRRSLGYDRGMLFIFDEVSEGSMWMKNTPLPLDIVFVDADSQVINVHRRTTPFSEEPIEPAAPRKFVVEVRAGFADKFGVTDSSWVRWTRDPSAGS